MPGFQPQTADDQRLLTRPPAGSLSKDAVMAAIQRQAKAGAGENDTAGSQNSTDALPNAIFGSGMLGAAVQALRGRRRQVDGAIDKNMADGGLVARARGFFGIPDRQKQIDDAVNAAVGGAAPQRAADQIPTKQQAITMPDGHIVMVPMNPELVTPTNPAGIRFVNGGRVRGFAAHTRPARAAAGKSARPVRPRGFVKGAGTGTSDSIPAKLSNGEYVLPADTVRKVGVNRLDNLRAATHKPVRKPVGFQPRTRFADGGVADDTKLKPSDPFSSMSGDPSGMQARALAAEAGAQAARIEDTQAQHDRQVALANGAAPTFMEALTSPIGGPDRSMPPPVAATGATRTPQTASLASVEGTTKFDTAPAPAPAAAPAAGPATPPGTEIAPGVFRDGNSYTNIVAGGAGSSAATPAAPAAPSAAGFRVPTFEDIRSADAVARANAPTATAPQVRAPFVPNSTNDFASSLALRNAGVAADAAQFRAQSGQIVNPRRPSAPLPDTPEMIRYKAMVAADQQAMGGQPRADVAAMRENAATGRQAMSDNTRLQENAGRQSLAEQELGLKGAATGFDLKRSAMQQDLMDQYVGAKTNEERTRIAAQIRALAGKSDNENLKNNFATVGGGQEWDANANTMRNVPQRLIDLRTGKEVGAAAQSAPMIPTDPAKRVAGTTYTTPSGKRVLWDGKGMIAAQ